MDTQNALYIQYAKWNNRNDAFTPVSMVLENPLNAFGVRCVANSIMHVYFPIIIHTLYQYGY